MSKPPPGFSSSSSSSSTATLLPPPPPSISPGWHLDPSGRHEYRYHDGQRWTDNVSDNGMQGVDPFQVVPPPRLTSTSTSRPSAGAPAVKKKTSVGTWIVVGVVGLIAIGAVAGSGSSEESSPSSSSSSASSIQQELDKINAAGTDSGEDDGSIIARPSAAADDSPRVDPKGRPNVATKKFTPHVTAAGAVTVDSVTWRVTGARAVESIGGEYDRQEAKGMFVIVDLVGKSTKDETDTLMDDALGLHVPNGPTYSPVDDYSDASIFQQGDVQPDQEISGRVVFDVPDDVLVQNPMMRFNELGFVPEGTYGLIDLPAVR